MEITYILITLIVGVIAGILIGKFILFKSQVSNDEFNELDKEKILLEERLSMLRNSFTELDESHKILEIDRDKIQKELIESQSKKVSLEEKIKFQEEKFNELQTVFSQKFERIAGEILQKNSDTFARTNHEKLNLILNPLKEKIQHFEKKIEETHQKQTVETNLLKKEIVALAELNQQITTEANNLTQALKGDNKLQGNWGEMVLEKVLERSGLVKGQEYFTQGEKQYLKDQEGKHQKPDVVILLPDDKHIIVDAKVSLKAYEKSVNAIEDEEYQKQIKLHVQSVKAHVKSLSEKYYYAIEQLNAPDFVLLFLPIESSFSTAIANYGEELFSYAWEKKVVIVSPTTLLATLKTVASIWKNEKQNKNAIRIAEESGKLYDKFIAFVADLEKIGKHIKGSQDAYDEAFKKLQTGRGNLLDKAQKLKKMGINAKKSLPKSITENSQDEVN